MGLFLVGMATFVVGCDRRAAGLRGRFQERLSYQNSTAKIHILPKPQWSFI